MEYKNKIQHGSTASETTGLALRRFNWAEVRSRES